VALESMANGDILKAKEIQEKVTAPEFLFWVAYFKEKAEVREQEDKKRRNGNR
jgi:hypothetical protein